MNRRGFLKGILAAGVAPAFVGSSILMPVRSVVVPPLLTSGNVLLTPEMITREALIILESNTQMFKDFCDHMKTRNLLL